jgi:hypothetical protein
VLGDLELVLITVLILHVDANVAKHLGNWRVTTRSGHVPYSGSRRKPDEPLWLPPWVP